MTAKEAMEIRNNPTFADVDNKELHQCIDEALEQQIPRKTNGEYCPCCKRHLRKPKISVGYTGNVKKRNGDVYCPSCGQALDWNANKDKDTY